MTDNKVTNLNVGILGHVDSGKTSIGKLANLTQAKVLSTMKSTAAFDKNPQSQERGITLDLGFSAFYLPEKKIQITLVDCPGHSSLIKTVIGGSQIIDIVLLVIDVVKGIQTQTSECILISEITVDHLIVILNKIDLIPVEERSAKIASVSKNVGKVFSKTKFKNPLIIPFSVKLPDSLDLFLERFSAFSFLPTRNLNATNFLLSIDHCFVIKGKGTVVTGTVLEGKVSVADEIELPQLKVTRKVKAIQVFKQNVDFVIQGDRAALLMQNLDMSKIERGIACTPSSVPLLKDGIFKICKIKYFKFPIQSKTKYHITIGHETVLASITLIKESNAVNEFEYLDSYSEDSYCLAYLQFEKDVWFALNATLIASRLDFNVESKSCRIAFYGKHFMRYAGARVFIRKYKKGRVDKIIDANSILGKDMFHKETKMDLFIGKSIKLNGIEGIIESKFGLSGKFKCFFKNGHGLISKEDGEITLEIIKYLK